MVGDEKKVRLMYVGKDEQALDFFMEMESYHIVHCTNGMEAVLRMKAGARPDVIVAEVVMAGVNGYVFYHELMKMNASMINVFLLTDSLFSAEEKKRARLAGIDDVLEKPLKVQAVQKRIRFLLYYKNQKALKDSLEKERLMPVRTLPQKVVESMAALSLLVLLAPLFAFLFVMLKARGKGPVFVKHAEGRTPGHNPSVWLFNTEYTSGELMKKQDIGTGAGKLSTVLQDHLIEYDCPECKAKGENCSPLLFINSRAICENMYMKNKKMRIEPQPAEMNTLNIYHPAGRWMRRYKLHRLPMLYSIITGQTGFLPHGKKVGVKQLLLPFKTAGSGILQWRGTSGD